MLISLKNFNIQFPKTRDFDVRQQGPMIVSDWCQDGNTSSRMITEVKHLELDQFSDG